MAEFIAPIQRLIEEFRKIPGVGAKTAATYAFSVLNLSDEEAARFADAIVGVKRDVFTCPICHGLSSHEGECDICSSFDREKSLVCVVEDAKDVMTMERIRGFRGVYHVLGGVLSPLDRVTPKDLNLESLKRRVEEGEIKEIIVATNPTPKGDTTAAYIVRMLEGSGVRISRLAYGIPVGADIEYADEVTLSRAMEGRRFISDET
ncbi:MAG: recombination protein RecR [Clostridia bacterium]|nr:recombination protein RecR [Clostridia bacterium]